jgi:hypothetical protein
MRFFSIFSSGFYKLFAFVSAVLYSDLGWSLLNQAAESPFFCVPFLGSLLSALHNGISIGAMSHSALLPILELFGNLPISPALESLLPLCISFLPHLVESAVLWAPTLERLLTIIDHLRRSTPFDALKRFAAAHDRERQRRHSLTRTRVLESSHPYKHNQDEVTVVEFLGAQELSISFDTHCATERGCDYLEVFTDRRRRDQDRLERLTGSSREPCWRKVLQTKSPVVVFRFYSDGSVNDWGYKVTIKATLPQPIPFSSPPFGIDVSNELICFFESRMPTCADYRLPEEALNFTEEAKTQKQNEHFLSVLPGIGSVRELPPSVRNLLAFLKVNSLGLSNRDILALATTPPRFLPVARPSEKSVVDRVATVFQGKASRLPGPIDRLVKQITGVQS